MHISIKMKTKINEKILIPEGIICEYESGILKCKKGSSETVRKIELRQTDLKIKNNEIVLECKKGNKNNFKIIKSAVAHINNMLNGLEEKFVYKLEACNVHFPITMKIDSGKLVITNFLGEKTPRIAKIFPGANVEIKGPQITITSHDREAAGKTAANMEKATKIKARDRRIYQDGIFITSKPGRKM